MNFFQKSLDLIFIIHYLISNLKIWLSWLFSTGLSSASTAFQLPYSRFLPGFLTSFSRGVFYFLFSVLNPAAKRSRSPSICFLEVKLKFDKTVESN